MIYSHDVFRKNYNVIFIKLLGFKQVLSDKCKITDMNVWKVKLSFNEIENISKEDDIKNRDDCKKIDDNPMLNFKTYYNADDKKPEQGCLHIFIVPTSIDTPNKRIKLEGKVVNWWFVPSIVLFDF
ncbi:hypothetical protein RhiirC2_341849 [Rhizophagus irregularis]|uniref:Uncharacterized protein n=1 Tax=Rhizophagus irregularis TaxID=588596 RepID=A0A2N1M985_9GLOM|nr:hypothetical protein RhiirC2_341849 [Rhizophagus irregularis]